MVLDPVAVIGLFFGSAMSASRQGPEQVRSFGETLGIGFAPAGWALASCQSRYRELTVRWGQGVDEWNRVVLEHPRPLHLGLYRAFGTSPRHRDLFGRCLILDGRGLKCLAADESNGTALSGMIPASERPWRPLWGR